MNKISTKQLLLNTAIELFKAEGYDATNINAICVTANVTRNAFYYHYSSKEALLDEYIENNLLVDDELITTLLSINDPWEQVWHLFEAHISFFQSQGLELCNAYLRTMINGQSKVIKAYTLTEKICLPLIKKSQDAHAISNLGDPYMLNRLAVSVIVGNLVIWCSQDGDYDVYAMSKMAIEHIFQPISKTP